MSKSKTHKSDASDTKGPPHLERKLSVMSESAQNSLDNIELTLDRYTKDMLTIDEQFNTVEDVTALLVLKNQVIQLMGNIEKLQFDELDAIVTGDLTSGKNTTKIRRKKLNGNVCELQQTCQSLFDDIGSKVAELQG